MDDSAPFGEIHREMALASRAPLIYLLAAFVVVVLNRGNWPFERKKNPKKEERNKKMLDRAEFIYFIFLHVGVFVGNGRRSEQNGGLHLCRRPNSPHSSLFFFFFFFFFLLGFISGRNFVFEANSCRRIYRHTRAKNLYNVGRNGIGHCCV